MTKSPAAWYNGFKMRNIRQAVIEMLSQSGPLPVAEIASAARVSTMALRYHLALLAREGLIVQKETLHRGNVGRPLRVYALADRAHERLPKNYNALTAQLLDEVTDTLGAKDARAMLRRAGRHVATAAPPLRSGAGIGTRMNRAT
ncbi:MAG: ArsR family transcriptional regulator, partial [Chloroflexota bacterium]|nr:ArsR family transcriptional regulator [Chloroflexota bacterium]